MVFVKCAISASIAASVFLAYPSALHHLLSGSALYAFRVLVLVSPIVVMSCVIGASVCARAFVVWQLLRHLPLSRLVLKPLLGRI